jgi:hypothetical protein
MGDILHMPRRRAFSQPSQDPLVSSLDIARQVRKSHDATIIGLLHVLEEIDGVSEVRCEFGRVVEVLVPKREFLIYVTGLPVAKAAAVLAWWEERAV